jgi:hypothetical protein
VSSPDPMDAARLADDCAAYVADRHAEQVLAQHGDTPAPPQELFRSLLYWQQPQSSRLRGGLFELWLRAEPKPKGGIMSVGHMENELPVLHWLLREQVAAIFEVLIENRRPELRSSSLGFWEKLSTMRDTSRGATSSTPSSCTPAAARGLRCGPGSRRRCRTPRQV